MLHAVNIYFGEAHCCCLERFYCRHAFASTPLLRFLRTVHRPTTLLSLLYLARGKKMAPHFSDSFLRFPGSNVSSQREMVDFQEGTPVVIDCGEYMVKAGDPVWRLCLLWQRPFSKALVVMIHQELCFPLKWPVPEMRQVVPSPFLSHLTQRIKCQLSHGGDGTEGYLYWRWSTKQKGDLDDH